MVVRLGGDLTIDEQSAAAERVVSLVRATRFDGVHAVATGSPLLVKEINDRMRGDMALLGAAAALAMAVVLLLSSGFGGGLLSLGVMVLGVIWGFGVIGYLGIPLTMVTISGLPILIGLGVDFAVQIHSRYEGELAARPRVRHLRCTPPDLPAARTGGERRGRGRGRRVPRVADFRTSRWCATTGCCSRSGPQRRFVAALVPLPAVLVWRDRHRHWTAPGVGHRRVERATHALSTVGRGHTIIVLVVALLIAIAGSAAMGRTSLESDPERWVPQDSTVLRDLRALRTVAGSSAELGLMVETRDVLRPDVLRWMSDFEARAVQRFGDQLVSSTSVASITSQVTFAEPTTSDARAVLAVAPAAIRRSFISNDGTRAQILFAIGPISLDQRKQLVARLVAGLQQPSGCRGSPIGTRGGRHRSGDLAHLEP